VACRAASSICRIRTASLTGILHLGPGYHFSSKVPAEILGRAEIHLAAENSEELFLEIKETEKSGDVSGLELDEYVYVAVRTKVFPQHRPKQGKLANVVPLAELSDPVPRRLYAHAPTFAICHFASSAFKLWSW
jgi:hypothetical protein